VTGDGAVMTGYAGASPDTLSRVPLRPRTRSFRWRASATPTRKGREGKGREGKATVGLELSSVHLSTGASDGLQPGERWATTIGVSRSEGTAPSLRSPTTASFRTASATHSWRRAARSSGCACLDQTRRACSGRSSIAARASSVLGLPTSRPRSRCQRSKVSGLTRKQDQRDRGIVRLTAASKARSAGSSLGRGTCRRGTVSWWRSTRSSRSFVASPRVSSASSWMERQSVREASLGSTQDSLRSGVENRPRYPSRPANPQLTGRTPVSVPYASELGVWRAARDSNPQPPDP
jgi:hypothetical protein